MIVIRLRERPTGSRRFPEFEVDCASGFNGQAKPLQLADEHASDFRSRLSVLFALLHAFNPTTIKVCFDFYSSCEFLGRSNLAAIVRTIPCRRFSEIARLQKDLIFRHWALVQSGRCGSLSSWPLICLENMSIGINPATRRRSAIHKALALYKTDTRMPESVIAPQEI